MSKRKPDYPGQEEMVTMPLRVALAAHQSLKRLRDSIYDIEAVNAKPADKLARQVKCASDAAWDQGQLAAWLPGKQEA